MANNIPLTYVIDIQAPGSQNITKQLKKSLSSADQSADALSTSIRNVGESAENTGKDLTQTASKVNKLSASQRKFSRTNSNFTRGAGNAATTLTNFNRVVQDAPFGIIGIANNIDPLVDSFQRLKTSTGGARGALKSLVGSLAGPQGVLFAVSAVTSLLVAFGPQIKEFFTGPTKEATEETKKFTDRLLDLQGRVNKLKGIEKGSFDDYQRQLVLVNNTLNPLKESQAELNRLTDKFGFEGSSPDKIRSFIEGLDPSNRIIPELEKLAELKQTELQRARKINSFEEAKKDILKELGVIQRFNNDEAAQALLAEEKRLEFIKERQAAEKKLRDQFGGQLRPDFAVQIPDDKIIKDEVDLSLGIIEKQLDQPLDKSLLTPFLPPESTFQNLEDSFRNSFFKIEQIGQQTYTRLRQFADLSAQQQVGAIQDAALAVTTSLSVAFGETKALRTAEAVINGAAAIVNTFASVPYPASIAAAALIAAKTAKQIATINSTQLGSSKTPTVGGGGSGPTSGFKVSDSVDRPNSENLPNPSRDNRETRIEFKPTLKLDERGLAIQNKKGQAKLAETETRVG